MKTRRSDNAGKARWFVLLLIVFGLVIPCRMTAAGTWSKLASQPTKPTGGVGLMLLLSDGTVLAASRVTDPSEVPASSGSEVWYKLTPDSHGCYVNGSWSTLKSMKDTRLWFSSCVLRDGKVFVAGAKYGTGTSTAEVYDPVGDVPWTPLTVPTTLLDPSKASTVDRTKNQAFVDSISKILTNGSVLVAPVYPGTHGTLIYDPSSSTWSAGPTPGGQQEASWVKLKDDSILTVDQDSNQSERFIPSST